MKTISSCKNLDEFHAVIKDVEGPVLGKGGGRKFLVQGKEVSMNTLVHKYFTLLKKAPLSPESHNSALNIVNKLNDLNHIKMDLSPKQEKRLASRQKWGNFFAKVKYGPAFSHKNLKTDALKIIIKHCLSETTKAFSEINHVATQVIRKKIDPKVAATAVADINKKYSQGYMIEGFLEPAQTSELFKKLAKPFVGKYHSVIKKLDKLGIKI